jgi:uncharacterized protein (DUF1919 family)
LKRIKKTITKFRSYWRSRLLNEEIHILKNKKVTIISQNCYGGIFSHDYQIEYMTPTINLYFSVPDFVKFCKNIEEYIKLPLKEVIQDEYSYPVGILGDLTIHFVHYISFEEANKKWQERCGRIDLNNLYFMMSDRDGCTNKDLLEFDKLKCRNKVVFVREPRPEIKSALYVPGYKKKSSVGNIYKWKGVFGKRKWDRCDFNFVGFINHIN